MLENTLDRSEPDSLEKDYNSMKRSHCLVIVKLMIIVLHDAHRCYHTQTQQDAVAGELFEMPSISLSIL